MEGRTLCVAGCRSSPSLFIGGFMDSPTATNRERQSFAEAALRLSGKTEEEARRTGAVDRADDQVEALFALQYQTAHSPVHRAVWEKQVPLELFRPSELAPSAPCD